jgi:di/tripeptidase
MNLWKALDYLKTLATGLTTLIKEIRQMNVQIQEVVTTMAEIKTDLATLQASVAANGLGADDKAALTQLGTDLAAADATIKGLIVTGP